MNKLWQKILRITNPSGKAIPPGRYKLARLLWGLMMGGVLFIILFFIFLSFQNLPTFDELENPQYNYATVVYFDDETELGRLFKQNRVGVNYDDLSPYLVQALLSTEDNRFYSHAGVDFEATARVIGRTMLLADKSSGGGSTITQQLAKLLYSNRDFRGMSNMEKKLALVLIKFKEWITAIKLERSYTKEEIIAMYLNQVEFVYDAFGIKAAAETYFDTSQDSLKIEQAATLVGMLVNPARYNPKRFPQNSLYRRNLVLDRMHTSGYLSRAQRDSLKQIPLETSAFRRRDVSEGNAPYFILELSKSLQDMFRNSDLKKPDGSNYDIYKDGLKIYTTLDPVMQELAEQAVWAHMPKIQKQLFTVWKNSDPWVFEADDRQKEIRRYKLNSLVRESDRFLGIRDKILGVLADSIDRRFDFVLTDNDILRMLEEENKAGKINDYIHQGILSNERASKYRQLMDDPLWPELVKAWKLVLAEADKEFNTRIRMKVFDYNESHKKDTSMTPMDSLRYMQMFLQTGTMAIEPGTGKIRTWVGGIDHRYFKFDHITADRQVGSTFKPFIYATAIGFKAISPCLKVVDRPYTISPGEGNFRLISPWSPKNSEGRWTETPLSLYQGLAYSVNSVSVFLMKELGNTEIVCGLVNAMGIDSSKRRPDGEYRVPRQPSICLGSSDLTVMEMTGAYSAFANDGKFIKPYFIDRIEDKNGRVIFQAKIEESRALPSDVNYVMVDLLRRASPVRDGSVKSIHGGKTGTTNSYKDGWYMGVTPGLVVGTWVGGDLPWIRFKTLAQGQGSVMAKPIFAEFLKRLEADPRANWDITRDFYKPDRIGIEMNCAAYDSLHIQDQNLIKQSKKLEDEFDDFEY
ncbi:MAG TPA: transglycosylase domain-containing protein [Saprospiraceae bacterium]|nr:transglycosylase domain-containing protein [Saprospiraceae bacterium]HNT20070.1 transglycosylase domain-containing protein [Saprospiraceae bacterium]